MINGIGYPKFYIYDSTGVTLQTIPTNLGTSGVISLTKRVIVNEKQPDRYDIVNESPYTRTELREFLGYKYKCSLTVVQEDYLQGFLQYSADQATTKVTDIYKLKAIEAYANAGYKIKFTPHNDLEDLWGSQFPIWVDVKITRTGKSQRIYSDSFSMEIHGTELLNSPYPFTAFDLLTSGGVSNTNQSISFASASSQHATASAFSCGTVHSIEFWTKTGSATFAATDVVLSSGSGGQSALQLTSTTLAYQATSSTTKSVTHAAVATSFNHWVVTRTAGSIVVYLNGAYLGSVSMEAGDVTKAFSIDTACKLSTSYYNGKLGHLRVYSSILTPAQIERQYNSGYGNWPVDTAAYVIWEMDGTGGISTTETDQSGNSRTLTLANTPTRGTWA